jgi:hypothetical protein
VPLNVLHISSDSLCGGLEAVHAHEEPPGNEASLGALP